MNENEKAVRLQALAARLWIAVVVLVGAYFFMSTLLRLLLPFLLAAVLACLIRPMAAFLEKKWRVPRRVGGIVLLIVLLVLLSVLIVFGIRRLLLEAGRLANDIGQDGELIGGHIERMLEMVTGLSEHIPFLSRLKQRDSLREFWTVVDAKLLEMLSDTLRGFSARIPDLIARILGALPSGIIFLVTFLLAAFYCCADGERIWGGVVSFLPKRGREAIGRARGALSRMGGRYLRAYFLLFLLTFALLFLGFSILRLPYTFLPALLISLVDILPVFGVGTVLVPWGAIEFLRGNGGLGTGLFVLCGVMLLFRQIAEPKIIGGSLGLHPLATLFAAYVGLELFGLLGMLLGPAVALLVKQLCKIKF